MEILNINIVNLLPSDLRYYRNGFISVNIDSNKNYWTENRKFNFATSRQDISYTIADVESISNLHSTMLTTKKLENNFIKTVTDTFVNTNTNILKILEYTFKYNPQEDQLKFLLYILSFLDTNTHIKNSIQSHTGTLSLCTWDRLLKNSNTINYKASSNTSNLCEKLLSDNKVKGAATINMSILEDIKAITSINNNFYDVLVVLNTIYC